MGADTFAEVPDTDHTGTVTANELALVGMDDHIVDRSPMDVVALETAGASIPDLDSTILGAGDHPLALAVEGNSSDIVGVTVEGHHRVGVGGFDIIQLDIVMTGGGQVALVRGDAKTVDLGVRVLDSTRADTGQGLPEADRTGNKVSASSDLSKRRRSFSCSAWKTFG